MEFIFEAKSFILVFPNMNFNITKLLLVYKSTLDLCQQNH